MAAIDERSNIPILLRPSIAATAADGRSGCWSHGKSIAEAVVLRRNRSVFIRPFNISQINLCDIIFK